MSSEKTILLLTPSAAEQMQTEALAATLSAQGRKVEQLMIEGNYERVLDALAGAVVPVVVK
jgi:hypothetical protein